MLNELFSEGSSKTSPVGRKEPLAQAPSHFILKGPYPVRLDATRVLYRCANCWTQLAEASPGGFYRVQEEDISND